MTMSLPTAAIAAWLALAATAAAQDAPPMQEFAPPGGKGRAVLAVSGQSGPGNYAEVARQLAAQGFLVQLVDGNDVFKPNNAGEPGFRAAVARLQTSPKAQPGKIGVVGFSLGGGAALTYGTRMPDQVGAVVAYYPYTAFIRDHQGFADRIKVPTVMLAAVKDTWKDCCAIDTARRLAAAAKGKAPVELVEYAQAEHGFILKGPFLRQPDAADALKRAVAHLRQHLAETPKTQ